MKSRMQISNSSENKIGPSGPTFRVPLVVRIVASGPAFGNLQCVRMYRCSIMSNHGRSWPEGKRAGTQSNIFLRHYASNVAVQSTNKVGSSTEDWSVTLLSSSLTQHKILYETPHYLTRGERRYKMSRKAKVKCTDKMNADVLECKRKAKDLISFDRAAVNQNGRKKARIEVMNDLCNAKGYEV